MFPDSLSLPAENATRETLSEVPVEISAQLAAQQQLISAIDARVQFSKQMASLHLDEIEEKLIRCALILEKLNLANTLTSSTVQYVERFDSLAGVDTANTTAQVDTVQGTLTLRILEMEESVESVERIVAVPAQCVGIPGNNIVIRSASYRGDREPSVYLDGDPDNHAHELALIDGKPDTWFEWERNIVQSEQPLVRKDTAYVKGGNAGNRTSVITATEGLDWDVYVAYPGWVEEDLPKMRLADILQAPDDKPARLDLMIYLTEPVSGAWFNLNAIVIGHVPIRLERLEISPDGLVWKTVAKDVILTDNVSSRRFYIGHDAATSHIHLVLNAMGFYRPRNGLAHLYRVLRLKITNRTKLLGVWQISKSVHYRTQRIPVGERAVGSLVVKDTTTGLLKLAGAYIGTQLVDVRSLGAAVMKGLSNAGLGKPLVWLSKQLFGSSTDIFKGISNVIKLGGVIGTLIAALIGSLLLRTSQEVDVESDEVHADIFDGWRSAFGIREIGIQNARYAQTGVFLSRPIYLKNPVRTLKIVAEQYVPEGTSVRYEVREEGGEWKPIRPYREAGAEGMVQFDQPVQTIYLRANLSSESEKLSPIVYAILLEGM